MKHRLFVAGPHPGALRIRLTGVENPFHLGRAVGLLSSQEPDRHLAIKKILTDSQESCVFTGTLRDNLTLATPIANDAAILRALQARGTVCETWRAWSAS